MARVFIAVLLHVMDKVEICALFLVDAGVAFASVPFIARALIATLVILTGVIIITYHKHMTERGRVLPTVFHVFG